MTSQLREQYIVTYPGYKPCTLSIITENLQSAYAGNENMQVNMAIHFFKALGYDRPPRWFWSQFEFTATGEFGQPPRHARDADVERYGCTCTSVTCGECANGHHYACTDYCQFGQLVSPQ